MTGRPASTATRISDTCSLLALQSEIPSGMCAKLRTVAASNNRDHTHNLSYYCLLALHILWCYSSHTSRLWWITQSTQHHRKGCNNIPSFLQRTTPIARSSCEGLNSAQPPHPGHSTILLQSEIPSGMCANLRTVAASKIEIMLAISLIIACSRYIYYGVILRAHPVRGESHNQRNTTGEIATLACSQDNE